jgi:hypothetical protein
MFPLFWRQKEVLKLLNEERRSHHRELKNKNRKQRIFEPGDIVMVRKQVQSNASEGIPAKLLLRTKGPYRVLEKVTHDSYQLQKIPGTTTMIKKKGSTPIKESAFRMHKIPSTIVIHKRVDTSDTRLAGTRQILSHSPLEQQLGLVDFGRYATTASDTENAFERIRDMWEDEDEPEVDSSDDEEEVEAAPTTAVQEAARLIQPHPINQATTPTQAPTAKNSNETNNATKEVLTTETVPEAIFIRAVYEINLQSKDRLYIIAHQEDASETKTWYVVQLDMDETNEKLAKTKGQYHCKWYIPNPSSRREISNTAFWPLIKEYTDEETYGKTIIARPDKATNMLKRQPHRYAWYQKEVNIIEDAVSGPFDFEKGFTVPDKTWNEVRERASQHKINVANITEKPAPYETARKRKAKRRRTTQTR